MDKFLLGKTFTEHHKYPHGEFISESILKNLPEPILFLGKKDAICVEIKENRMLHTIYYIGVDWINKEVPIYVEPKLNENIKETDFLTMLFSALNHPEIAEYCDELFEIKFHDTQIEINQQQDKLTPLLIVLFIRLVQEIVRKGLKKSYYRVEKNLNSRIKGKILVSRTIKDNIIKNKMLKTYCSYDEFGYNGYENRLLKKALTFVQRFLPSLLKFLGSNDIKKGDKHQIKYDLSGIFNYINPAFENISDEVNLNDVKHTKKNVFYKEYEEAIKLAKLILKRFGYNITNTENQTIMTPPFWIDMSKLFELYVLGLLKDRFGNKVEYHFKDSGNELDFILKTEEFKMVIDAKYKTIYQGGLNNDDIRQVSGYARLKEVYKELYPEKFLTEFKNSENDLIDCLIIYPDQDIGKDDLKAVKFKENEIEQFVQFYKVAVKLPVLKKNPEKFQ